LVGAASQTDPKGAGAICVKPFAQALASHDRLADRRADTTGNVATLIHTRRVCSAERLALNRVCGRLGKPAQLYRRR